jgi:hypothetical protein
VYYKKILNIKQAKDFKVTDEQNTTYFNRHYDQLQKQWKDHCDRYLAANLNKVTPKQLIQIISKNKS